MILPDRKTYIGGSDAAAILGVSPWQTGYQLWAEKTGLVARQDDPAKARIFARGKRLEPVVLQMFEDETGLPVHNRNQRYQDPEYPFLAAEIDGETGDENIDAKTAQPFARHLWGAPGTDEIPIYYAAQFMHGLMVTGRKVCHVAALIGLDDFRVFRVQRDDDLIQLIRQKEIAFWDMVRSQIPPPVESAEDALSVWPQSLPAAVSVDAAIAQAVADLKEVKANIKNLEKREEQLRDAILPHIREAEAIKFGAQVIATWKTQSSSRLDQASLAAAHPEIVEAFKTTSTTRILRIK